MDKKLEKLIGKKIVEVKTPTDPIDYDNNIYILILNDGTEIKWQYQQNEGQTEIDGVLVY
jgi:hypothetical protein